MIATIAELWIDLPHLRDHLIANGVEHRLAASEKPSVTAGSSEDAAKDVPPTLVSREHAIGDQERNGAGVVGHHPERDSRGVVGLIGAADQFLRPLEQRHEKVGVEIGVDSLQGRRDTLQAGTGIDRRLRQRSQDSFLIAIELHEDQVPDLDNSAALGQRRELVVR